MHTMCGRLVTFGVISITLTLFIILGGVTKVSEQFSLIFHTALVVESERISADAWLIFDVETGESLFSYNADSILPIASIAKLPAATAFYEHNSMWATTSIVWADVLEEGRAGKLYVGEEYTFHTLLFPLLLESSNDAAHVFARVNTELVSYMNKLADDLYLPETFFADSSGLSSGNVSTAHELSVLIRYIYAQHPHLIDITGLDSYLSLKKGWLNNNPFIADQEYIGGKHGYTPAAGKTVIALFDEAYTPGLSHTTGYILLGSKDLLGDMAVLRRRR